jgi:hypothetical protein
MSSCIQYFILRNNVTKSTISIFNALWPHIETGYTVKHRMRSFLLHLIVALGLLALGCEKKLEISNVTSYEEHSLGENSTMWSAAENQLQSDPLEVCKEIVRSSANPTSEEANDCRMFLLTGDYTLKLKDWRSGNKRLFGFRAWKLSAMVFEFPVEQADAVRKDLILRFGAPIDKNEWLGPDGAQIFFSDPQQDKTFKVAFIASSGRPK